MRRRSKGAELFRLGAIPLALALCMVLLLGNAFAPAARPGWGRIASWLLLLAADLACAARTVRFRLVIGRAERRQPLAWSVETALLIALSVQALRAADRRLCAARSSR